MTNMYIGSRKHRERDFTMRRMAALTAATLAVTFIACVNPPSDGGPASEIGVRRSALTATSGPLPRGGWIATSSVSSSTDVPAHALDGNGATRFSTGVPQASAQWFQVDMRSVQTFAQLTIDAGGSTTDYPRGFQVFVSNDGASWGLPVATAAGTSALTTVSFGTQSARFVRIVLTASSSNWWSIAEFNVLGRAPALSRTSWVASASLTCQSDVPAHVLDGNLSTRWSTGVPQASGQWFQIDMKTAHVIGSIVMDSATSNTDYARAFQIFAFNDPANMGPAIVVGTGAAPVVTVAFPAILARYVRVTLTGGSSSWWSIHELNLFGPSSPDDCTSAIRASTTLTGSAREIQYQQDILQFCTGTGIAACEQTLRARINVDNFMASAKLFSNRIDTGTYIAVLRDRESKLRAFRGNPTLACDVAAHDGDGDFVPDSADACPDTPPLTPVLANGCTNTQVKPGPDINKVQKNMTRLGLTIDPRCVRAPRPAVPTPLGVFRLPSDPTAGKVIWISRDPGTSGCPNFYDVEFSITDGSSRSTVFPASEDTTVSWITRPSGAVQFNIHATDPGDRGAWASYAVYTRTFRVRAFNLAGMRTEWSDYFTFGNEDCVADGPCVDQ